MSDLEEPAVEWGVIWDANVAEPGRIWTEGIDGVFGSRAAVEFELRRFPHQLGRVVCRTVTPWTTPADRERGADTEPIGSCGCSSCQHERLTKFSWPDNMRYVMALCPTCGNKRCPGAMNHRNECSGSNEPGQPRGRYV